MMKDIYSLCEPMRKPHLQFKRATQHFANMGRKACHYQQEELMCEFMCACTCPCGIQLSVVSIYACMCKCSPYSTGRCVLHPLGHQSDRESSSSRDHT